MISFDLFGLQARRFFAATLILGCVACRTTNVDDELRIVSSMKCNNSAFNLNNLCDDEVQLLTRALRDPAVRDARGVDRKYLKQVSDKKGAPYAAALFFQRLNQEPRTAAYLKKVFARAEQIRSKGLPRTVRKKAGDFLLAMVPAIWYDSPQAVGGDGRDIRKVASSMGFREALIRVNADGTVEENAKFLCSWLTRDHGTDKIILASISKGAMDIKRGLQLCPERFKNVRGWLNIGGINRGSYLITEIKGNCFYNWQARRYFASNKYTYETFRTLDVREDSPVYKHAKLPDHMRVVNVVATPIRRHLTKRAEYGYNVLSKYGPNDGLTVIADSYMPGAVNISLWGTDHYFAIPERRNLLLYAALYEYLSE